MREHDTEWKSLKSELLDAVREGAANAETLSLEDRDRLAQEEERAFRARFRCDRPQLDRQNLIRLKHEADLTDREIRLLLFTCSLRFGGEGVHFVASLRGLAFFGRIVMGFLGVELLEAWYLASHSSLPVPALLLRLVGVMAMMLAMGWGVQQIYLRPRQIQCRVSLRCGTVTNGGLWHRLWHRR